LSEKKKFTTELTEDTEKDGKVFIYKDLALEDHSV